MKIFCGKCGKAIEGTAGICYYCRSRYTITAANLPCLRCAAIDQRMEDVEGIKIAIKDAAEKAHHHHALDAAARAVIQYLRD